MPTYEIAELNIGIIRGPIDSPIMADFIANLGRIYAMADASCGFAWRLQTEAGDATAIRPFENENIAINMSVWRDIESLLQFVYHSSHTEIMHRRSEWFERMGEDYMVLWVGAARTPADGHGSVGAPGGAEAQGPARRGFHVPPEVPAAGCAPAFGAVNC
jgi:hypothetical protein